MRSHASILHVDLDAFFAAVEQRDKPSLRGRPVVVGGLGQRGVVATASYEARSFGIHSAMPMHEARQRCPHAAFLAGRFAAYRAASGVVMGLLSELSPLVEPLSLDEAFVDLAAGGAPAFDAESLLAVAADLRARLTAATGGLTASVGLGTSKFMAKVASELAKPDGIRLIVPGTEVDVVGPLSARAIPGVGPATMERLSRLGVATVADVQRLSVRELVRELGKAGGENLHALARARDDRPVEPERETKSLSAEDTFEHDVASQVVLAAVVERQASSVAERLQGSGLFARTVTVKVRWPDFSSISRSRTLNGATDHADVITRTARSLLEGLDTTGGVRLVGVGVSGLSGVAQEALFDPDVESEHVIEEAAVALTPAPRTWSPGADVVHAVHGPGWVWGSGLGRVTVRFETAETPAGPVRTFLLDDPDLSPGR